MRGGRSEFSAPNQPGLRAMAGAAAGSTRGLAPDPAPRGADTGRLSILVDEGLEALAALGAEVLRCLLDRSQATRATVVVRSESGAETVFTCHAIAAMLAEASPSKPDVVPERLQCLSRGEMRVLRKLALAHSTEQVAAELFLTDKTVRNYVSRILHKLGVTRRAEAVAIFTGGLQRVSRR